MYIHIVEIPTNKGANSYKLKISKKREKSVTLGICYICIHNFDKKKVHTVVVCLEILNSTNKSPQ